MKKLSNYQKLKNQFVIIVEEYNNIILPYQLTINNIDTQYKAINNALAILKRQEEAKKNELHDTIKAVHNKRSFFKQKKYIQYAEGYNIFVKNSNKLYNEYNNILAYLSLKKLFINCQIDYITINTISKIAYYMRSFYGYFNITDLKYKKYEFIYKLLQNRNLYIKNNTIWAGIDNYYICNSKYANSPNQPYKALNNLFNIKIPASMLQNNKYEEDNFLYMFKISTVPANKMYILVNRFLEQIKVYSLKLKELEDVKINARYIINRSNTNEYYNTFLDGYSIEDICKDYNYGCTVIKDIAKNIKIDKKEV